MWTVMTKQRNYFLFSFFRFLYRNNCYSYKYFVRFFKQKYNQSFDKKFQFFLGNRFIFLLFNKNEWIKSLLNPSGNIVKNNGTIFPTSAFPCKAVKTQIRHLKLKITHSCSFGELCKTFFFFYKYPAKTSRSNFSEKFKFSATLCDNTALTIITSCKPLPCRYLTLARIRLRSWSKYNNLTFDSQDVWRCTLLYKQLNEEPCQTEISVKIKVTGKDNFLTPAFQDTFPSQL